MFEGENEALNPKIKEGETNCGDFFVDYGGESSKEVQQRMNETLTKIMSENNDETVLVVSHGGAIHMFLHEWLDYSSQNPFRLEGLH